MKHYLNSYIHCYSLNTNNTHVFDTLGIILLISLHYQFDLEVKPFTIIFAVLRNQRLEDKESSSMWSILLRIWRNFCYKFSKACLKPTYYNSVTFYLLIIMRLMWIDCEMFSDESG